MMTFPAEQLITFLSRLPDEKLMAITAGAFLQKHRDPRDAIHNMLQLCSTLCGTLGDKSQLEIIEAYRIIADALERPMLLNSDSDRRPLI